MTISKLDYKPLKMQKNHYTYPSLILTISFSMRAAYQVNKIGSSSSRRVCVVAEYELGVDIARRIRQTR